MADPAPPIPAGPMQPAAGQQQPPTGFFRPVKFNNVADPNAAPARTTPLSRDEAMAQLASKAGGDPAKIAAALAAVGVEAPETMTPEQARHDRDHLLQTDPKAFAPLYGDLPADLRNEGAFAADAGQFFANVGLNVGMARTLVKEISEHNARLARMTADERETYVQRQRAQLQAHYGENWQAALSDMDHYVATAANEKASPFQEWVTQAAGSSALVFRLIHLHAQHMHRWATTRPK
jgi:hypothetical protein